jgi:type IV pilus assembly protein PilA
MILKLRQRMAQEESGFTLVELLVVMLILGLLAAIAIPAFFNQRDKARDADAKVDARTAQTAAESYATDQPNGDYTGMDPGDLVQIEETLAEATNLQATPTAGNDGFTVSADSATGATYSVTRDPSGAVTRACDPVDAAGCQNGSW